MILGLQITAIFFAFAMIYFAFIHYKKENIDKLEISIWTFVWLSTIFATAFPTVLRENANRFSVSRLFDLMVVGGFILVISMVVKVYVSVRKVEKKIEKYVRQNALDKVKATKKGKKSGGKK